MATKRGLGKGLDALFTETEQSYDNARPSLDGGLSGITEVQSSSTAEIEISTIFPNPDQPRKNFDVAALNELASSIKTHGIIQPIVLNKMENGIYMIIAGERRYRAAQLAGLKTIPAVVKEYDEKTIKEISIIENLQREDLNAIEAARAIQKLMNEFSYTQEQVAERLGKSRPAIANTLRLLRLSPAVISHLETGKLSEGHARPLIVIEDVALQIDLAKRAIDEKLSVRDFEDLVRAALKPKKAKPEHKEVIQTNELKDLVDRLQRSLATRVQIIGNDHKGRIFIDYFTRDDLDRINDLLAKNPLN